MVSLIHVAQTTTEFHLSTRFMPVSEARFQAHFHFLYNSRAPTRLLAHERHPCHHASLGNVHSFAVSVGTCSSSMSAVMSMKKGFSITTSGELCLVVWTVEADLTAGQLLYITGEPISLGGWQPDMALPMGPTDHANLWKTEVKIPSGVNFKYNYFIREERQPSGDLIWRPGPEFSLSVPLTVRQDRKIMVRDLWFKYNSERSPPDVWGSWLGEACLPLQPLDSAQAKDKHQIVNDREIDLEESKAFMYNPKFEDKLHVNNKHTETVKDDGQNPVLTEIDQPVEEPWLFQSSMIFLISTILNKSKDNDPADGDAITPDINKHQLRVNDKLLPADGNYLIPKEDSVSTVILINSSICTMQRVAVLEEGKLVELLLEPVKTNVQSDSVYLGVVTKFVPHMGGAFVNIGNPRPSLMDIKQNREPFIFSPFNQGTKKEKGHGSEIVSLEEHEASDGNEHVLEDVEDTDDVTEFISQEGVVSFELDDHDEHEADEDYDMTENINDNGSIVDYGQADMKFEHFLDGREHHLEGEIMKKFPSETTEGTNGSPVSGPQNRKDSESSLTGENKWLKVRKGTKIVVQVVKEGLGTKGPTLTAYPKLRSRFWILHTRCDRIGISKKISGVERTRLRVIAKTLQPHGFGLTVRTVAAGHSLEELQKDLEGSLSTWKNILEHAKSAALAADEGIEGSIPVILHRAMGQTLSVVQDYFTERVKKMVVDSPRTYYEVTNYLQEIAPDLCDRVELYDKRIPLFDEFKIEEEINHILSKRVPLPKGGSLVIEQTEALVSIDVNGGHVMFGQGTSQEKAILDVNLEAARQIARELRLRDIGGIIIVDFIDMADDSNKRLVYEEMKKAVEGDRSTVKVSELSKHGIMEITRKRVRPSVTFMISEPCTCCHGTGRVEALETSFSKIEQEICRLLATMDQKADPESPKTWPRFLLRVDHHMCNYLTSGKRTRLAILSSSLKVWILLKVARGFTRGAFEVKPFADEQANETQHQIAISMLRQAERRTINPGKKVTLVPVNKGKSGRK